MNRQHQIFNILFAALMALVICSAVALPRFLAFGPGLIALVFSVIAVFGFREQLQWPGEAMKLVLPVLAVGMLSALWAIAPHEVVTRAGRLGGVMMPGLLLIALARSLPAARLNPYLWIIPAGVLAAALLTTTELQFNAPLYRLVRGTDFTGNVQDHEFNRGAVTVVLCLFPAMAMLKRRIGWKRGAGLAILAMAPMLLSIESQSAQLALALGLAFALVFPYKCRAAWIALSVLIAAYILLAPFAATWAFGRFAVDVNNMPLLGEGDGYAGARMEIWDYVGRYALHRPLLGYGLEACRMITDFDSGEIYQPGTSILHPHNFALQLWLEAGVIGALGGAAFFAYLLHIIRTRLSPAQARIVLPTVIAGISVGSTGYGMWQGWWVGLLFLAAALCILAVRQAGAVEAQESALQA